jgi:predicted nucleotidyltransferase
VIVGREGGGVSAGVEKTQAEDPVLVEIVRRLVGELQPRQIYLFGSRARGDAREDSDFDVLVVVDRRTGEGYEMEQRAYHALRGLGVTVEVLVMTRDYFDWMLGAAASLPATVRREGHLLYAT